MPHAGAGKYHTRFHREWTKIWPFFIVEIRDNPFVFQCTLCLRQISCRHMDKADVERHISTPMHVSNVIRLQNQLQPGSTIKHIQGNRLNTVFISPTLSSYLIV